MTLATWWREIVRDPLGVMTTSGTWVCCYCGEPSFFPVHGLNLDRVARAHYLRAWRKHAQVTLWRAEEEEPEAPRPLTSPPPEDDGLVTHRAVVDRLPASICGDFRGAADAPA